MRPLVSVLIPAFNAEKWIALTLRSVISQTWPRMEIIVVDDGSTDNTHAIARSFESNLLRVVSQPNQGAAVARDKAFSLSQGDYIQWLDADDLLHPHKIAKQMEAAEQCQDKRMLFSSAWSAFKYRYYRAKFTPSALWCDLSPVDFLVHKMAENLYMQPATWLVSRELTDVAGAWDPTLVVDDDGEYFCRVLLKSSGIRFVPEAKVFYRRACAGTLSDIGQSNRKLDAQWCSVQLHIKYLLALEHSERTRAACVKFLQTWFIYYYPHRPDVTEQMEETAKRFGGTIEAPPPSWKVGWIKSLFGWQAANQAQLSFRRWRWWTTTETDKLLLLLERPREEQHCHQHCCGCIGTTWECPVLVFKLQTQLQN